MPVGPWQHERYALALLRADRTEQICVLIALVGGLAGAGAFPRPQACPSVLLTQSGFILKPDFDWGADRQVSYMRLEDVFEVFLNAAMTRSSCLGCCGRTLMGEKPIATSSLETVRAQLIRNQQSVILAFSGHVGRYRVFGNRSNRGHVADLCRLPPAHAVIDSRQRQ